MRIYRALNDRLSRVYTPESGLGEGGIEGAGDAAVLMFNKTFLRGERSLADATHKGRGLDGARSGVLAYVTLVA